MITDKSYKSPSLWRHPRLLMRRIRDSWPFLVWVAGAVIAYHLYADTARFTGIHGVVEVLEEPVAPLETARLLSLDVELGQRVAAGDVIARMDTSLLEARAAIEEARLIEAEGAIQDYQQSILEFVRDFELAIKEAEADLEVLRLESTRDTAVLEELKREETRLQPLVQSGVVTQDLLSRLRPEIASLEQTVAAYPALIEIRQRVLSDARQAREDMRRLMTEDGENADTLDIVNMVQEMRKATGELMRRSYERWNLRRTSYTLRATRPGVISRIFHQPGDVVDAGEQVVRIVDEAPTRVIGFLPEVHLSDLKNGQRTWIFRMSADATKIPAVVHSIAPEVQTLPMRISPIRGQATRGRRVVLDIEGTHNLIPGETVRVARSLPWIERVLSASGGDSS